MDLPYRSHWNNLTPTQGTSLLIPPSLPSVLNLPYYYRIGFNLTAEEERSIENVFNMYNASTSATIVPMMSHQNSQQTITQSHHQHQQQQQQQSQYHTPTSAPTLNFFPVFDDEEIMSSEADKSPADMDRPTSRHVPSPFPLFPIPSPRTCFLLLRRREPVVVFRRGD